MSAEDAAQDFVGRTIADKYRLLRVLGAGGMGAVYEAEHVFTKRHVALKRMHQGIAKSKLAAERFVRESQAPSSIGHPGIVQVLDGGFEADGSLYLVLELLEGVSMREAIEDAVLDPPGIVQIGLELLEALGAAHAKGFIHRDIKPDNVFLASDGRGGVTVKLLDFGIAAARHTDSDVQLTATGAVLGTPLYMSPEQARGLRVDARSDLWSVGALLYRSLSGSAPFDGESYNALIVSIVTQEHTPLAQRCAGLPDALIEVVETALQKDPEQRFQSAKDMLATLARVKFDGSSDQPSLRPLQSSRPKPGEKSQTRAIKRGARKAEQEPDPDATSALDFMAASEAAAPRSLDAAARQPQALHEPAAPSQSGVRAPVSPYERTQPSQASAPGAARAAGGTTELTATPSLFTNPFLLGAVALLAIAALLIVRAKRSHAPIDATVTSAPLAPIAQPPKPLEPTAKKQDDSDPNAQKQPRDPNDPNDPNGPSAAKKAEPLQPAGSGLSSDQVTAVLEQHQSQMQRCLQEAVVAQMMAGKKEAPTVRLDVELQITASGQVERVSATGEASPDLAQCVERSLQTATFPPASAPTEFHYPLVFQPTIVGK